MITLHVSAEQPHVQGFRHLWAKYVSGFDPTVHCMKSLIGHRSTLITRTMQTTSAPLEMTETRSFDYLYICGVTGNWNTNFHFVLRPTVGVTVTATAYNGTRFIAEGAEAIEIPWLADGYCGLPREFTTCRNYQFGEAFYPPSRASDAA
jgi:hypothetical protein